MKILICSAPDCEKPFKSIMPHAKYCSERCRWRYTKRKQVEERLKEGSCPQCAGEMTKPKNAHNTAPNYCNKCQEYFQEKYIKRKGEWPR